MIKRNVDGNYQKLIFNFIFSLFLFQAKITTCLYTDSQSSTDFKIFYSFIPYRFYFFMKPSILQRPNDQLTIRAAACLTLKISHSENQKKNPLAHFFFCLLLLDFFSVLCLPTMRERADEKCAESENLVKIWKKDIQFLTNFIKKRNKIMMWEKVFPFFLFIFSWFDLHTDFNVISGQLNISTIIFRCVYNNFFIAWNFFFLHGMYKILLFS